MKENNQVNQDGLYVYPTDTVWGIGGNIFSKTVYDQIASIKRTRFDKPLSIMFANVEEIFEWFYLPAEWQNKKELVRILFSLEITLAIPREWAKKEVPFWIHQDSIYISVRCLENQSIKKIYQEVKAPIFTTSLNLTGMPPITNYQEALLFKKTYANEANFICDETIENDLTLSGAPSTQIALASLKGKLTLDLWRKGKRWEEIMEFLQKNFSLAMTLPHGTE